MSEVARTFSKNWRKNGGMRTKVGLGKYLMSSGRTTVKNAVLFHRVPVRPQYTRDLDPFESWTLYEFHSFHEKLYQLSGLNGPHLMVMNTVTLDFVGNFVFFLFAIVCNTVLFHNCFSEVSSPVLMWCELFYFYGSFSKFSGLLFLSVLAFFVKGQHFITFCLVNLKRNRTRLNQNLTLWNPAGEEFWYSNFWCYPREALKLTLLLFKLHVMTPLMRSIGILCASEWSEYR